MLLLRKYRLEIIIAFLIIGVFAVSRLLTLLSFPIFTDEAIYLRWAQIAKNDPNWRFISLTDGKQPLFIWLTMIAMRFITDPLLSGRLVSVGAGFASLVGLFLLGREVFKNRWVGIITASLYAFSPFALIYDRLALYDSLVATFAVWGLYLTVKFVRTLKLDTALLLGIVSGLAVLNKTSGFFILYLLPFSLLLLDFAKKQRYLHLIRFVALSLLIVIFTYAIYSLLRLSPYFYIIDEKNSLFVYPFSEWIKHPFIQLLGNAQGLISWFLSYIGIPVLMFCIASFFLSKEYMRGKLLLALWFLLPFIALLLFGKQLYPRYIFFMTLSLFPLAGFSIFALSQRLKKPLFIVILLIFSYSYFLISDFLILTNPAKSPIPESDKGQYLTGWPSGVGVKESVRFFTKEAEKKPIVIATGGTFGLLPYAYEIYLYDNPNVTIKSYWPINTVPQELTTLASSHEVYLVFYQECPACPAKGLAPVDWPLEKLYQVKKEQPDTYFTVYKLTLK